jgi:hypothetical protein
LVVESLQHPEAAILARAGEISKGEIATRLCLAACGGFVTTI